MSNKFSFNHGRVREDGTGNVQRIQEHAIPASLRIFATRRRLSDNFHSVLFATIDSIFRGYDHIEREAQDVVVPLVLQEAEILRAMFVEGGQSHPRVGSAEGVVYDDPMDDDDDDNNDSDGHQTDDDDMDGYQPGIVSDFSNSMYEMNASLSIPPLYPAPVEYADPRPSRTRSFFALPVYMLDKEGNVLPIEQSSWMVFRVCESGRIELETGTWTPHFIHERSYGIIRHDKAAQFVDFFGAILLSKAKWFRDALLSTSSSTDPAPMSDQNLAVSYLYRELHLENADDFEPYLQKTIEDLEKSVLTNPRTDTSTEEQHTTSSALLSYMDQRESNAMDVDDDNESGAYLTTDKRGRQHHVCKYHHMRLYPRYAPGHVETQTNGTASYDILTGKITAVLTSQDALTDLLKIDPDQVGFVSESVITVDWEASIQDIDKLLEFAARFGINAMTISGGDRQEALATPQQVEAETNHVRELLKTTTANLTRVTVNWASKLDVSALLKEMSETREDLLYLAIDDSQLKVLSVIYKRHLVVSRIKSALGDLPSVFGELSVPGEPLASGASFLSGKAQSLEISSGVIGWSNRQTRTAITDKFKRTIQANPALTSLAVECPVGFTFREVVKAIDEIVRPLNSGSAPRLKFRDLIVRNSSDNDVVALYDLSQSSQEASVTPLALDVTARSSESLSWISRNLGASVRILHLIGTTPGCLNNLNEIVESERHPDRLVSLTLLLDFIRPNHIESLDKLLVFSKKTFKQLALIAQPPDKESKAKILSTLQTLQGFQVLLTRTAGTEWIKDATNAVHASSGSTVDIVESAEELVQKVPGFTGAGLDCLKAIFNRSGPVVTRSDDIIVKYE
ncbi:hypothetical protein KI688_010658 [Linnemannia hyalina]|uniref:Uncharacterized protein n=1 Tax=Linnemannia hyalina TaxID=64524 RepID=A0A9P7XW92_9FUNG|nr:hypothetical protein KI688_010658 [Linnemannia hyalina]